jgi:hypothetical protein
MVKSLCFEETTLNQYFGEFRGAGIASLPRIEFDPGKLVQLRYVLIWNEAGAALFQIGTGRLDKFLH